MFGVPLFLFSGGLLILLGLLLIYSIRSFSLFRLKDFHQLQQLDFHNHTHIATIAFHAWSLRQPPERLTSQTAFLIGYFSLKSEILKLITDA